MAENAHGCMKETTIFSSLSLFSGTLFYQINMNALMIKGLLYSSSHYIHMYFPHVSKTEMVENRHFA